MFQTVFSALEAASCSHLAEPQYSSNRLVNSGCTRKVRPARYRRVRFAGRLINIRDRLRLGSFPSQPIGRFASCRTVRFDGAPCPSSPGVDPQTPPRMLRRRARRHDRAAYWHSDGVNRRASRCICRLTRRLDAEPAALPLPRCRGCSGGRRRFGRFRSPKPRTGTPSAPNSGHCRRRRIGASTALRRSPARYAQRVSTTTASFALNLACLF
jgi:hypothetical protein